MGEDEVLIDFPTSKDGIAVVEGGTASFNTVKINVNKTSVDCIKFANSGTTNGVALTVEGGFKAGDKVQIAGAISVSQSDLDKDTDGKKRAGASIYTKVGDTENKVYTTTDFINGQLSADDPTIETYILESDCDALLLARDGGTGANITLLKVTREIIYGNPEIEGEWEFTIPNYWNGDKLSFTATLEGNTVTFEDESGDTPMIGVFTSPTTINFSKTIVKPAMNNMWQIPYEKTGEEDQTNCDTYKEKAFTADYDSETGTITFPDNIGILFFYFNATTGEPAQNGYYDEYEITKAVQLGGASEPTYEVVGKYPMAGRRTDMSGINTNPIINDLLVEVRTDGEKYWMAEVSETNYFKGYEIPFTYNDATKMATFTPAYVGTLPYEIVEGYPYVWSSAFVGSNYGLEPMPQYAATFTPEDGFEFGEDGGIALFYSSSENEFKPNYETVYGALYFGECTYGDNAMRGEWDFTYTDLVETLKADISGNTVKFKDEYGDLRLVGTFVSPTEIEFRKEYLSGEEYTNSTWQVPFVNTGSEEEGEYDTYTQAVVAATYDAETGTIKFPENSGILFGYYNNETGAFAFWNEAVEFVSAAKAPQNVKATITYANYGTFYAEENVIIPADVTAYGTSLSDDNAFIILKEIEGGIIPAETAVIIYSDTNWQTKQFRFVIIEDEAKEEVESILTGTVYGQWIWEEDYVLWSFGGENTGFYHPAEGGVMLEANKAYLEASKISAGTRPSFIVFGDNTTGIKNVVETAPATAGKTYSVTGAEVAPNTKGLVIKNGKKYVNK